MLIAGSVPHPRRMNTFAPVVAAITVIVAIGISMALPRLLTGTCGDGCHVRRGRRMPGPWPWVGATLAEASSEAISSSTRAPGARRSPWSVLGWQGGGEKVGEQLVDALVFVVMDPVRGVGQALDAVEVGHVVVVRLG
jgi:hypothetical protein